MSKFIKYDARLAKDDLSNVVAVYHSTQERVVRVEHFPDSLSKDRKLFSVTESGNAILTSASGCSSSWPEVRIDLEPWQAQTEVYVVEHKETGVRTVTFDCSVTEGEDALYILIANQTIRHY